MKYEIRKIFLKSFIEKLMNMYDSGVDYIDLTGELSSNQDTLKIEESKHVSSPINLDEDITDYI